MLQIQKRCVPKRHLAKWASGSCFTALLFSVLRLLLGSVESAAVSQSVGMEHQQGRFANRLHVGTATKTEASRCWRLCGHVLCVHTTGMGTPVCTWLGSGTATLANVPSCTLPPATLQCSVSNCPRCIAHSQVSPALFAFASAGAASPLLCQQVGMWARLVYIRGAQPQSPLPRGRSGAMRPPGLHKVKQGKCVAAPGTPPQGRCNRKPVAADAYTMCDVTPQTCSCRNTVFCLSDLFFFEHVPTHVLQLGVCMRGLVLLLWYAESRPLDETHIHAQPRMQGLRPPTNEARAGAGPQ